MINSKYAVKICRKPVKVLNTDIYSSAILAFGKRKQIVVAMEELAEMIQSLSDIYHDKTDDISAMTVRQEIEQ